MASTLLNCPTVLVRFEDDGTSVVVATRGGKVPAGARAPSVGDSLAARVRRAGAPVRLDDVSRIDERGVRAGWGVDAAVAVPVVVDGRPWGLLAATSPDGPLPTGTEERLTDFSEFVATWVAGAQARAELGQMSDEQRALRTVAELVARGAAPDSVFAAVARLASGLLAGVPVLLVRFDGDRHVVVVASHEVPMSVGLRVRFAPGALPDRVRRSGGVDRVDDYGLEPDSAVASAYGLRAAAAAPIVVAGTVWGMLTATSAGPPLAPGTERRLDQFARLVGTALANLQARHEIRALADEHAALRRLAELVARAVSVPEVLAAVACEASELAGVDFGAVLRYGPDGAAEIAAVAGAPDDIRVGLSAPAEGDGCVWQVWRTAEPARSDDLAVLWGPWPRLAHAAGYSSGAAAPMRIDDTLWGALVVLSRQGPLPSGVEDALFSFSQLAGPVVTAARARRQLQAMAEEQAALRRVAELVARARPLPDVFAAIATEASSLLGGASAVLMRYVEGENAVVVVAASNSVLPEGFRIPTTGDTDVGGGVLRWVRPVRLSSYAHTSFGDLAQEFGVTGSVSVPVVVEGHVWGLLGTSRAGHVPPEGTEDRLAPFAELAAAAIANAENKAKLTASRARVVATADEARRRLQRDVHDSAQQRLVHTIVSLQLARAAHGTGEDPSELLDEALRHAERATRDLRDIVRGILPAALNRNGLGAGLESLVQDIALDVELRVDVPRLGAALETTAYFVAAEALANVVKHAGASSAHIDARVVDDVLVLEVRDDGVGGADPARGSGLVGLLDRVEATDGALTLTSPPGAGTTVRAELPLPAAEDPPS